MFGISGEHLIILAIILIVFGPRRLPELGNTMGKAIRNFKDAIAGVEEASFRKLDETQTNQNSKPAGTTESQQASKDNQDTNSKPS